MHLHIKAYNRTQRYFAMRSVRRSGVGMADSVVLVGRPIISRHPKSTISLGANSALVSSPNLTALGVAHPVILRTLREGAVIEIGDDTGISGASICANSSISIGRRCLLGADVAVFDTNFHPLEKIPRRYLPIPQPSHQDRIVIGDDVFIGMRAIVLPGTTIGDGAVIGAGSVVRGVVEDNAVYAGNPAKKIRSI